MLNVLFVFLAEAEIRSYAACHEKFLKDNPNIGNSANLFSFVFPMKRITNNELDNILIQSS